MLDGAAQPANLLRQRAMLIAIVLACAAGGMFWYATGWGIGLSPDSAFYIKSARQMLGREQPNPLAMEQQQASHFPPGYSTVLAIASMPGVDPISAARVINLLLFMLNIGLTFFLIHRATRGALLAATIATNFIVFTPASLDAHATALSEPLFIALILISFLLLETYVRRPRPGTLVAAALTTTAAILTRYAGLALVPVGLGAIILFNKRFRDAAIYMLASLLPLAVLAIVNAGRSGSPVNRQLAFHLLSRHHITDALSSISQWMTPGELSLTKLMIAGALILLAIVTIAGLTWRRRSRDEPLPSIAALFIFAYLALLILSICFVDFHTQLDERLLAPALFASAIFTSAWVVLARRPMLLTTFFALVTATAVARGMLNAHSLHAAGSGYASLAWRNSELIRATRELPTNQIIFTNGADVVYLLGERPAAPVPAKINATSTLTNPDFESSLAIMQTELAAHRAVVIYFTRFEKRRPYYPTEQELTVRLNLRAIQQTSEGSILAAP